MKRTSLDRYSADHCPAGAEWTWLDAVKDAIARGFTVGCYTSPVSGAKPSVTESEAADIAAEDASLIYVEYGKRPVEPFGWVIDRDYLESGRVGRGNVGASCTAADIRRVGERFRLRDDDGEIHYGGWIAELAGHGPCPWSDALDWGAGYSGCTEIQRKDAHGNWVTVIG